MHNNPTLSTSAPGMATPQRLNLPSRLTAIVFDLDGTLVDSSPGIASSLAAAFQSVGRVMPEADFRKAIGPPIRIIARRVEPSLTDDELDLIEPFYRADYDNRAWRDTVIFDGVADTLREFHAQGLRLFIITNKPRIPTTHILAQFNLQHLFHEILTRDGGLPPFASKAEMLATLIERHGLSPDSTVMVGDTGEDQETAHANHVPFLHVTYGCGTVESAHKIDLFPELAMLLKTQLEPSGQ
jgi:phosphoglycolate phosphatase